jgi:hypothetical protein
MKSVTRTYTYAKTLLNERYRGHKELIHSSRLFDRIARSAAVTL